MTLASLSWKACSPPEIRAEGSARRVSSRRTLLREATGSLLTLVDELYGSPSR